jgi:hypothetical protein
LASPYLWGPDAGTQRAWTSDQFREVLKRETQARLGQALNITTYWDITIGISRRFMRVSSAFTSDIHDKKEQGSAAALDADQEAGMDVEQWMAHIVDLQAAHSSHVARMVYARQIMEQAGTTGHWRAMFWQSSVEWHEFLGFPRDDGHSHGHHPAAGEAAGTPSGSQAVRGRVRPPGSTPSGSPAVRVRVNQADGPPSGSQPVGVTSPADVRVRVHPAPVLGKRKRAPWQAEADEHQMERRQQLQAMDMTAAMWQMTG